MAIPYLPFLHPEISIIKKKFELFPYGFFFGYQVSHFVTNPKKILSWIINLDQSYDATWNYFQKLYKERAPPNIFFHSCQDLVCVSANFVAPALCLFKVCTFFCHTWLNTIPYSFLLLQKCLLRVRTQF